MGEDWGGWRGRREELRGEEKRVKEGKGEEEKKRGGEMKRGE